MSNLLNYKHCMHLVTELVLSVYLSKYFILFWRLKERTPKYSLSRFERGVPSVCSNTLIIIKNSEKTNRKENPVLK